MIKTKLAVIGGGPVGLFSSLLLQHFNIQHVTFQRHQNPRSHPSAHWISGRSKQILSQIPNLAETIDQNQQTFQSFRHYRYCQSLFGFQFGFKDHFQPSIQERISRTKAIFGQYPNHMSQAKLLQIMYQKINNKDKIIFDSPITSIQQNGESYNLYNHKKQKICEAQYVILANGFNSQLRDNLGIKMQGQNEYMNIINIHFQSKKFAQMIKQHKVPAMLHFIYNKKMPSILVNHSYEEGVFVLQVPNYQPFVDLAKVYTPRQLISTIVLEEQWKQIDQDLKIIHVGKWKLQALLADRLRKDKIFLVGDTAHTFTPAGGFGMNSGFQDANQIIHFIDFIKRNQKCNKQKLFNIFDQQRRQVDSKYLKKSLQNYNLTQQTAQKVIKYSKTLTSTFLTLSKNMPTSFGSIFYSSKDNLVEVIRLKMMSLFYQRAKFQPQLQLFFDDFDKNVCNISQQYQKIIQNTRNNTLKDLYVHSSISQSEIHKIFGQVNRQNIQFFDQQHPRQKIIRRDGIFM